MGGLPSREKGHSWRRHRVHSSATRTRRALVGFALSLVVLLTTAAVAAPPASSAGRGARAFGPGAEPFGPGARPSSAFNQAVVDAFASSTSTVPATAAELKASGKRALNVPKFSVITACTGSEISWQYHDFSIFPAALLEGIGWDEQGGVRLDTMIADTNADGQVTLNEAYVYSRDEAKRIDPRQHGQNAQVYPENSDFVLYAR